MESRGFGKKECLTFMIFTDFYTSLSKRRIHQNVSGESVSFCQDMITEVGLLFPSPLFFSSRAHRLPVTGGENILTACVCPTLHLGGYRTTLRLGEETPDTRVCVCVHVRVCICVCFRRTKRRQKKKQNHHQRPHEVASQPQILGLDLMNGS